MFLNVGFKLLGGLVAVLVFSHFSHASAQTEASAVEPAPSILPYDTNSKIFIEGLNFSKLVLDIYPSATFEKLPIFRRLNLIISKNLCWSGFFRLLNSQTRYCPAAEDETPDLILEIFDRDSNEGILLLRDNGPTKRIIYRTRIPLHNRTSEKKIMATINAMTKALSGDEGILGKRIAYSLRQPGYSKIIVETDTHGREMRIISNNTNVNLLPNWSPNGLSLTYTVLSNTGSHVYLNGLSNPQIESRFLTKSGNFNTGGTFAPDGKSIIVTTIRGNSADANLYALELLSGRFTQLSSRRGIETQASWSPDGSKIVYVSDRNGSPQIYVLYPLSGDDIRITFDNRYNVDPEWSRDGRFILFTRRIDRKDQIHIMSEYGEDVRQITFGNYNSEQPSWSPDGRQLVFVSDATGRFKIYVVSADGSNLRRLTDSDPSYEESNPTWSPAPFYQN